MEDPNEKKDFKKADERFDKLNRENRSKIELKKKIFMKISDVDPEDALKFKEFCDKHTDKKQFLGLKVLMLLADRFEPLNNNIIKQLNSLYDRVTVVEEMLAEPAEPEDEGVKMPKTQGSNKKTGGPE